jgi:hypothetical protein
MKADRLEPGMAHGLNTELFGNLPLEEVDLRALWREGGERSEWHDGARGVDQASQIVEKHSVEPQVALAVRTRK